MKEFHAENATLNRLELLKVVDRLEILTVMDAKSIITPQKVRFRCCYHSSEEVGYNASNLNRHDPELPGWHSLKFCEYPQEIGLEIISNDDFPETCTKYLTKLQILSHEYKIASRIEMYVGLGDDYQKASFDRLGHMNLDGNERSHFKARELKTVFVEEREAKFIRLIIHRPHRNAKNLFSQVAFLAINVIGLDERTSASSPRASEAFHNKEIEDKMADYKQVAEEKAARDSLDNGLNEFVHNNTLSLSLAMDIISQKQLQLLLQAKADAIELEDFDKAKAIKVLEHDLKVLGVKLRKLDSLKAEAIRAEDYDYAKQVKEEAINLRVMMDKRIAGTKLASFRDYKFSFQKGSQKSPNTSRVYGAGRDDESTLSGGGFGDNLSPLEEAPFSARHHHAAFEPAVAPHELSPNDKALILENAEAQLDEQQDDDMGYMEADSKIASSPMRDNRSFDVNEGYGITGIEGAFPVEDDDQLVHEDGHPLEGVPNAENLPAPEPIDPEYDLMAMQSGIWDLLGEYRAKCLFSKHYALREAVLIKIRALLQSDSPELPTIDKCFNELAAIIKWGVSDKIHAVESKAVALLEDALRLAKDMKHPQHKHKGDHGHNHAIIHQMNPIINILLNKMADGNGRTRATASQGIDAFLSAEVIGPAIVAHHVLKPLDDNQATHHVWRPLVARLQLLRDLVVNYGLNKGSGLDVHDLMEFPKINGCFGHSHGEVRDAAKDLTVVVEHLVGSHGIHSYLKLLRPKQLEDYKLAFQKYRDAMERGADNEYQSRKVKRATSLTPRLQSQHDMRHHGKINNAATRSAAHDGAEHKDDVEYTSCMFCGAKDSAWTEDSLDLHYWKDCPMLTPCPACAQVVEIAGLTDHLLDECEYRDQYSQEETTGKSLISILK